MASGAESDPEQIVAFGVRWDAADVPPQLGDCVVEFHRVEQRDAEEFVRNRHAWQRQDCAAKNGQGFVVLMILRE